MSNWIRATITTRNDASRYPIVIVTRKLSKEELLKNSNQWEWDTFEIDTTNTELLKKAFLDRMSFWKPKLL